MDLSPLWISLKTASLATIITFLIGILVAYGVVQLHGRFLKGILDGILTLPLILPPTVVGFFLLKIFGVNGPIGKPLLDFFQIKIVFTWPATVITATLVAFPLMYRTTRGAFEQLDVHFIFAGRTLGLDSSYIFWKIIVPNCRQGILAGTVLSFARALGEFGATLMLAGNLPGKTQTISTAVYSAMAAGEDQAAYGWVCINVAISFASMLLLNFCTGQHRRAAKTNRKPQKVV